jgi:glycosyltransferase involved in cell wall biosynthesis
MPPASPKGLLPIVDRTYVGPKPPISIVILTKDEGINIQDCINTCAWCDDIHVLDSGSADNTVHLAKQLGAHLSFNPFTGFGAQRTFALRNIPTKHPWQFHLDADERLTPGLVEEISHSLTSNPDASGFFIANQVVFMNTWIKHATGFPFYQCRLVHRDRVTFDDHGHGQREVVHAGSGIHTLLTPYVHLNFSKGVDEWFARHNRYSTGEAKLIEAILSEPLKLSDVLKGAIPRRRALKRLAARLPARSFLRFVHCLIAERAILDGRPGITYAKMLATYESMIAIKANVNRAFKNSKP